MSTVHTCSESSWRSGSPPPLGAETTEESALGSKLINEMQRRIDERRITRLVHFTRITSLVGIIGDRHIESTRRLLLRGVNQGVNDPRRFDGHCDYVCCSVEYPNVCVLDRYRSKNAVEDWVVRFLSLVFLFLPTTRISPVNAATKGGIYVRDGVEGFSSMFEDYVPSHVRRGPHHLPNCPTDMQAEVLMKHIVPTWAITGMAVESDAAAARVAPMINRKVACVVLVGCGRGPAD